MDNSTNVPARPNFRSAEEKMGRLDKILGGTVMGLDLFSSDVTNLRMSLKDELEQLILHSSSEYVVFMSQDFLWRKVYYDVVNYFKVLRTNNPKLRIDPNLKGHILSGIGTYHLLLKRFRSMSVSSIDADVEKKRKRINTSIFKFNIALGDLSRYYADLQNPHYRSTAESYYREAIACMPNDGLPFNQLGTLYFGFNYSVDSIYYHMRGLLTEKPFQGTESNLKRFFVKNASMCQEVQGDKDQNPTQVSQVKKFMVNFVHLIDMFYSCPESDTGLSELCQNILQLMPECLPIHQDLTKSVKLEYIPRRLYPNICFKVMVILQMCFAHLRSHNNAQVTASVAFLFAFMSHIVCYAISACRTLLPSKASSASTSEDSPPSTPVEPQNQNDTPDRMTSPADHKKKPRRRRIKDLRRRFDSSDSDSSDVDSITSSDLSAEFSNLMADDDGDFDDFEALSETGAENERCDVLDSTAASLNASEELAFQVVDFALNENAPNENDEGSTSVSKEEEMTFKRNIVHLLGEKSYLCTIKIFCDWLRGDPKFLESCASSSQNLWSRLAVLVNYIQENALPHFDSEIREQLLPLLDAKDMGEDWLQPAPLHEDIMVENFPGFENLHSRLFAQHQLNDLNDFEQIAVRMKCLNQFCHFFDNSIANVDLKFSTEANTFSTPVELDDDSLYNERWTNEKYGNNDPVKLERMNNMTHLWLKSEVSKLKSSVRAKAAKLLSPFLVVHSSILIHHLPSVKKLTNCQNFIVVIPVIVIDILDGVKKTSVKAREASRWLESELKKGNRSLRAQKQNEAMSLSPIKYPRKKDKQMWDTYQIFECCNFIKQKPYTTENLPKDKNVPFVTLLISKFRQNNNSENFDSIKTVAAAIGVGIEDVKEFCSKAFYKPKKGR